MLPNHASLVVAEQFGMLEALHPGRIDLGIGRAPGTDQLTALALRRSRRGLDADDFPDQLVELMGYFDGRFPEGHPFRSITAVPGLGYRPALWLLGSSDYSARAAGALGLPFSFAHHFAAGQHAPRAGRLPRRLPPLRGPGRLYVMLGVNVVAAETTSGPGSWPPGQAGLPAPAVRDPVATCPRGGGRLPVHARGEGGGAGLDPSQIVAARDAVRHGLDELVERTGADELMVTTLTHDPADRLASYRLVAEAAGLAAVAAGHLCLNGPAPVSVGQLSTADEEPDMADVISGLTDEDIATEWRHETASQTADDDTTDSADGQDDADGVDPDEGPADSDSDQTDS